MIRDDFCDSCGTWNRTIEFVTNTGHPLSVVPFLCARGRSDLRGELAEWEGTALLKRRGRKVAWVRSPHSPP